MVAALVPTGGVVAEVGVFEGRFATCLLEVARPQSLILIDPWVGTVASGDEDGNHVRWVDLRDAFDRVASTLGMDPRVQIMRGRSEDMLPCLPDCGLDAVYLDGDHSYAGVAADLRIAWSKVKPGGWIMGHDYEMNMHKARQAYDFGVKKAVQEFLTEHDLSLAAKALDGCVSFAVQKPA